ncbi:MAG: AraC family transcriptional regulator [Bacteroidales bacterium]
MHGKIFVGWLFLIFFTVITFFFSSKGLFATYHWYHEVLCYTHVLHGPILYFYILSFINNDLKIKSRNLLLHLIPVVLFVVYKTTVRSLGLAHCLDTEGCFNSSNIYNVISVVIKLGILTGYVIASKLLINKIRNDKKLDRKKQLFTFNWLNSIIQGVAILMVIAWIIELLYFFDIPFAVTKKQLINFIVTIFLLTLIYVWNRYSVVLLGPAFYEEEKERYKSGLKEEDLTENYQKITGFLRDTKAFLDNDLTLNKISGMLQMSEHLVSETVNRKAEKSYSDFINAYRINYFLDKLEAGEHKATTLLGLALDCGFNSKSTFNRAFKQCTNQTPSEYIRNMEAPEASKTKRPKSKRDCLSTEQPLDGLKKT